MNAREETYYSNFKAEMFKRFGRTLTDKEMIEVLVEKNMFLQERLDEAEECNVLNADTIIIAQASVRRLEKALEVLRKEATAF